MRGRVLDVVVFVLSRPALGGEHSTAVDVLEIAVRELVPSFGILPPLVVDPQVPLPELTVPMLLDELVLLLCGRLVLAPRISLVYYDVTFLDEPSSVLECSVV